EIAGKALERPALRLGPAPQVGSFAHFQIGDDGSDLARWQVRVTVGVECLKLLRGHVFYLILHPPCSLMGVAPWQRPGTGMASRRALFPLRTKGNMGTEGGTKGDQPPG